MNGKETSESMLFEKVPCGIVRFSAEQIPRVISFNGACAQIYGYHYKRELLEKIQEGIEVLIYQFDREIFRGLFKRSLNSGKVVNIGYRIQKKNQDIGYIIGTMEKIILEDGTQVVECIFQDSGQRVTRADIRKNIYFQPVLEDGRRKKIILAEREEKSRLSTSLEDSYLVMKATKGSEIENILNKEQNDIAAVLVEEEILEEEKFRFLALIKCSVIYAATPIIVLAKQAEGNVERLLSYGANEVFIYPYNIHIIRMKLANLLELRDAAIQKNSVQSIINNLPGGVLICRLGIKPHVLYASEGIIDLGGYKKEVFEEYIKNDNILDFIYEADRERVQTQIATIIPKGQSIEMAFRIVTARKNDVWVHLHGTKIRQEGNEAVYQSIIFPTSNSEKMYQNMLDDAFIGIVVIDDTTKELLYINNIGAELLKEEWGTDKGKKALLFLYEGEKMEYGSYITKQMMLASSRRHLLINGKLLEWNGIRAKVFYITDDTENYQKQMKRLTIALNEAKQANEAKSMFLSRMSHDIRTPMNAILGISQLAVDEANNPKKVLENLEKISASGSYLLGLINDILDMSKIESDRVQLNPEPYSIKECVNFVLVSMNTQIEEKNICFKYHEKTPMPKKVMLDKMRFQQVFFNLLSNAVKFTGRDGEVEILVIPCEETKQDVYTRIVVRDNGIGISYNGMKKIFEPFEQIPQEGDISQKGSGLGLAIVKNLIQLMGGKIWVESEEGIGTKFIIDMKMEIAKDIEDSQRVDSVIPEDIDFTGYKVLLVEDHPINMEIAMKLLKKKNCSVGIAKNGLEAIEVLQASAPKEYQAVLMDVQMPVMNGLEATQRIRNCDREELRKIPIIAMTANAFEEDIHKSIDAGMNAHLAKPINIDTLYETLYKVLNKKTGRIKRC